MDRVCSVIPILVGISELGEVGGEGVTVEEDDMIGILSTNDLVHLVIKLDDAGVLRVSGLVQGVVPGDPLVALVVLGEL